MSKDTESSNRAFRAGSFCGNLVEAGWLFAAATVPVFFNPFSDKVFEPDKALLLRLMAAVMALAWFAGKAARPDREGKTPSRPLRLAGITGILAAVNGVATLLSVLPRGAFLGSEERCQGLLTHLALTTIALLAAEGIRDRARLLRLLAAVVFPSVPIALFAVGQALGLDPFPWVRAFSGRVSSTLGNPIFAGAYFSLSFFVTLALIRLIRESPPQGGKPAKKQGEGPVRALWAAAALQVAGLVLAGSRGPFLGFAAGLFVFLLATAAARGRARIAAGMAAAAVVAAIVLGLALFTPAERGALGGLRSALEPPDGTGRVRILLWQEAAGRFLSAEPMHGPPGPDARHAFRRWIGYGPDTQRQSLAAFYPPELARLEQRDVLPDRAHNDTWDKLLETGGVGLAAYLVFLGTVASFGLESLGLLPTAGRRRLLAAFLAAGATVGAGVPFVAGKPEWLGATLTGAFLLALVIFMAVPPYRRPAPDDPAAGRLGPARLTAAALLAALVACIAEFQVGIPTIGTLLLLYLVAAALAALPAAQAAGAGTAAGPAAPSRRNAAAGAPAAPAGPLSAGGTLAGATLAVALFPFLALTAQPGVPPTDPATLPALILLLSFALAPFVLRPGFPGERVFRFTVFTAIPPSLLGLAWLVAGPAGPAAHDAAGLFRLGRASGAFLVFLLVFLALTLLLLAAGLPASARARHDPGPRRSAASRVAAAAALAGLFAAAALMALHETGRVRADIFYRRASASHRQNDFETGAALCLEASRHDPGSAFHRHWLGVMLTDRAMQDVTRGVPVSPGGFLLAPPGRVSYPSPSENLATLGADASMLTARDALLRARANNPWLPHTGYHLGRLYGFAAAIEPDAARKQALVRRAEDCFAEAGTLCPGSVSIWTDWAALRLQRLGDNAGAARLALKAIALDPTFPGAHLLLAETRLAAGDFAGASASAESALVSAPEDVKALDTLAFAAARAGKPDAAISATLRILEIAPGNPMAWNMRKNLAILRAGKGDFPAALEEIEKALASAPADARPDLEGLARTYRARCSPAK
ncbi:MAG: tetratricopeptide repeat protein [Acidobacteria bacterium]|nr:tetratricopeptide repeat protein [Acidobacteriota bacterium]